MDVLDGSPIELALFLGNMFFSLSLFLFIMYVVLVQSFKSRTDKYKFVSEKERPSMKGSAFLLACSIGFYAFVLMGLSIGLTGMFNYIISGLTAVVIGVLIGYVLLTYLADYHPFILEKKLKDIRFDPMKSPITGKPMRLLNEDQEDVHLSKEMIEEEDTFSVDYDVWMDDESNHKVIERYDTRFHQHICESCNFRTLTERKGEVIKEPKQNEKGILRKHYECTHCGHLESKDVDLSSWNEEEEVARYETELSE